MKFPDLTIYGNYLGPFSRGTGPAIDDLDELARIHDLGYGKLPWYKAYFTWNEADEEFLQGLRKMDPSTMHAKKRRAYDLALTYFTAKKLKAPRSTVKGNAMALAAVSTGLSPYLSEVETGKSMATYIRPYVLKGFNWPEWAYPIDTSKRKYAPEGGYTHHRNVKAKEDNEAVKDLTNKGGTELFTKVGEGILRADGTFIPYLQPDISSKVYNLNKRSYYQKHGRVQVLN